MLKGSPLHIHTSISPDISLFAGIQSVRQQLFTDEECMFINGINLSILFCELWKEMSD